jgi:DNA-binding NarL/FixJ family response regulator
VMLGAQADLEVVGEAADGETAVDEVSRLAPDVVLMDIRMPGQDGLAATSRIRAAGEDAPRVIILTTFESDTYVYAAIKAGASGFLLKRARPEEIAAAIRVVAQGDALLAPSVTRRLIARLAGTTPAVASVPGLSELTDREREVLAEVARGHSNAEIAARLYLSEHTVKTHVKRIFSKLGLRDRAQAVVVAYESGLVRAAD